MIERTDILLLAVLHPFTSSLPSLGLQRLQSMAVKNVCAAQEGSLKRALVGKSAKRACVLKGLLFQTKFGFSTESFGLEYGTLGSLNSCKTTIVMAWVLKSRGE